MCQSIGSIQPKARGKGGGEEIYWKQQLEGGRGCFRQMLFLLPNIFRHFLRLFFFSGKPSSLPREADLRSRLRVFFASVSPTTSPLLSRIWYCSLRQRRGWRKERRRRRKQSYTTVVVTTVQEEWRKYEKMGLVSFLFPLGREEKLRYLFLEHSQNIHKNILTFYKSNFTASTGKFWSLTRSNKAQDFSKTKISHGLSFPTKKRILDSFSFLVRSWLPAVNATNCINGRRESTAATPPTFPERMILCVCYSVERYQSYSKRGGGGVS